MQLDLRDGDQLAVDGSRVIVISADRSGSVKANWGDPPIVVGTDDAVRGTSRLATGETVVYGVDAGRFSLAVDGDLVNGPAVIDAGNANPAELSSASWKVSYSADGEHDVLLATDATSQGVSSGHLWSRPHGGEWKELVAPSGGSVAAAAAAADWVGNTNHLFQSLNHGQSWSEVRLPLSGGESISSLGEPIASGTALYIGARTSSGSHDRDTSFVFRNGEWREVVAGSSSAAMSPFVMAATPRSESMDAIGIDGGAIFGIRGAEAAVLRDFGPASVSAVGASAEGNTVAAILSTGGACTGPKDVPCPEAERALVVSRDAGKSWTRVA
jgi:hypothetical protein